MKPLGTFCIFHGQLRGARFALPRASTLRLRAICNLIDVMFLWPSKAIATTFFKAIFLLLFQVRRDSILRMNECRACFFPFSCCYVVILVWSLILSGIWGLRERSTGLLSPLGSCLIYPKTTDAFLIAFLFSLRAKEEKERNEKKVTYSLLYYSFFFPSTRGPIWHHWSLVCARFYTSATSRFLATWKSWFRTSKAWDTCQTGMGYERT